MGDRKEVKQGTSMLTSLMRRDMFAALAAGPLASAMAQAVAGAGAAASPATLRAWADMSICSSLPGN